MADSPGDANTYSQEYVEKLRQEAAGWRTKYRDAQAANQSLKVSHELTSRGIKADPKWVEMAEGMSASDAVDNFVAKYPHLGNGSAEVSSPTDKQANVPSIPSTPTNSQNTNVPSDSMKTRSLQEIQKDPVARDKLREQYRTLISQSSRQIKTI